MRLLKTLVVLGCVLVPTWAAGQSLTVDETKFARANMDNDGDPPSAYLGDPRRRDPSGAFGGINLDECLRGEIWKIHVSWQDLSGSSVYVYSGTACDQKTSRDGEGDDCELIETITVASNATDTRDLEYGANLIANYPGDDCTDLSNNLRVWFVVLEAAGDETPVTSVAFPSGADIRVQTGLPAAPSNVTTGPGESQVDIAWDGATQGQKYYVLCSPLPGAQGGAASPNPTFDANGQEVCEGTPPTDGFGAGVTMDRTWRCDQDSGETFFATGVAAESLTVDGLDNDVQYFFGVVALDEVDNPSVVSELACSTPKPVDDFFELYRRAGGRAGGGVCSATPARPTGAGGAALLALFGLAFVMLARRRARGAGVLALALFSVPGLASAEGLRYLEDDYRSPQNFALELRGGPYYPDVDDEFGGDATPFRDTFDTHSRLRIGFEVDWQALHTPVGSLGVGGSAGLMRYVGNARFAGTGQKSSQETTLVVMPFVVSVVARLDFAMREWQIPLVPYGKLGFATYLWFAEDGQGTARADGPDGEADAVLGSGRTHGLELAGGVAFLLDFLEPGAARKFDADVGVNHSYVFFEVLWANVDGFGATSTMDLSDTTWNVGLLLEI